MMRRPRFTLRRMMVAVAAIALAFGVEDLRRRRGRALGLSSGFAIREEAARRQAQRHATAASHNEAQSRRMRVAAAEVRGDGTINEEIRLRDAARLADAGREERDMERRSREASRRYGDLARKYERVARFPWLPVEPDLPGPE